jgi:uncharacterized membrane-anchored protein
MHYECIGIYWGVALIYGKKCQSWARTKHSAMIRSTLCFLAFIFSAGAVTANYFGDTTTKENDRIISMLSYMDSVNKALKFEKGTVTLPGGMAKLKVPENFQYLNAEQSRFVVEELWGNLPQNDLLGMLFPAGTGPFSDSSYAFIITYRDLGYVKDDDAEDIDYNDVLKGMKEDDVEENKQRKAQGASAMYTMGWASPPYYDKTNKTLHWALDYKVEGAEENTLNYNVMLLGRKGILCMNAIGSLSQLSMVKANIAQVTKIPEFTEGNKYADYNSSTDKVAAWTIGGLVAGKLLVKAGFFAMILKFGKFIILGIAALGGIIFKFFKRKKQEDQVPYEESQTAAIPDTTEVKA